MGPADAHPPQIPTTHPKLEHQQRILGRKERVKAALLGDLAVQLTLRPMEAELLNFHTML